MIVVMYLVGLLTGLGIWYITHWIKSEPQIKIKRGNWNGPVPLSRRAPPKPPHNPHK